MCNVVQLPKMHCSMSRNVGRQPQDKHYTMMLCNVMFEDCIIKEEIASLWHQLEGFIDSGFGGGVSVFD